MNIEHTATIEGVKIPGCEWLTLYKVEVTGLVNLGSPCGGDNYRGFIPGEPATAEISKIVVLEAVDFRFGDDGVPLDFTGSTVTGETAGEWLLKELADSLEPLETKLIESLEMAWENESSLRS